MINVKLHGAIILKSGGAVRKSMSNIFDLQSKKTHFVREELLNQRSG